MPPKKKTEDGAGAAAFTGPQSVGLTENDLKLLDSIFKNCSTDSKPKPSISLDEVAQQLGLKSAKVVTDRYRQICNKVGWFVGEPSAATPGPKKAPASRKKVAAAEAEADDDITETPIKKRKVTKKATKPKVKDEVDLKDSKVKDETDDMEGDLDDGEA
ncbi:hypothetical protein SCUP234_06457 [Seiridium cupressi]